MPSLSNQPDFDVGELRRRYDAEREKRLRADRSPAVLTETPELDERDMYSPPVIREPLTDEVDVAIVGAGFAGILVGAQLRMRGVESIRVIDRAGDFGGTWYWNRYPSAQCDVESYIYLPMLEESRFMPSEKYARQPEIFEYAKALARQYGLYREACFQTQVTGLKWDGQPSGQDRRAPVGRPHASSLRPDPHLQSRRPHQDPRATHPGGRRSQRVQRLLDLGGRVR